MWTLISRCLMLCIRVCACVCVQLNLEAKGLHLMMDPRDGYQVTPLDKVRITLLSRFPSLHTAVV